MRYLTIISLLLFCAVRVFGQENDFVTFPDSLKTANLYFSPFLPYSVLPKVLGLGKTGGPYDSIQYVNGDDFDQTESVSTPRVLLVWKAGATGDPVMYSLAGFEGKENKVETGWLTLDIDTSQEMDQREFFLKSEKVYNHFLSPRKFKILTTAGKTMLIPCNKDTAFVFRAFPVTISNRTKETQLLYLKSGAIEIVQEAKDKDGKWRPIELVGYPGCGNGNYWQPLQPGEQLVTSVFAYKGPYKTLLRVKLKCRERIVYPGS